MEFTYEGLVRYGFGFYNPNHAAALICVVLPFVWLLFLQPQFWKKFFGLLLSTTLVCALAMTYSRSGIVVLALEAVVFLAVTRLKSWKPFTILGVVVVGVAVVLGVSERFTIDASASNRLQIWQAGLSIFAANPFGVGLGNSGKIATAFLLPDGINCRTLVNSYLTLLCEYGIFIGALWLTFIAYAILNAIKTQSHLKIVAVIAFCGLAVSATFASVFDFEVLFYSQRFEYFTTLNVAMQWLNFVVFLVLGAYLCLGNFTLKRVAASLGISCAVLLALLAIGKTLPQSPKYQQIAGVEFVSFAPKPTQRLVLFDDDYTLKSAWDFITSHDIGKDCAIVLQPFCSEALPSIPTKEYILFGNCSDFANTTNTPCILIKPSPYFVPQGKNISAIYLPKWDKAYERLRRQAQNIQKLY